MPTDPTRDPHGGFEDGNGVTVVPGDRVEYRFGARRGRLIMAFSDGDVNVTFDDGAGPPMVKWRHLCKVPAWAESTTREPYAEGVETHDDEWDFWVDEARLFCVGYTSAIDEDALAVLKGIVAGKFNTDLARELSLPEQYVELLQSIFCSVGWAEYGTSPRGCWIDPKHDAEALISKFERFIQRRWN